MSKFTFVYENRNIFNDGLDNKLTMESNVDSLNDVIEQFEMFLKGAGYVFDGRLDFVQDNDYPDFDDEEEYDDIESFEYSQHEEDFSAPSSAAWPFPTDKAPS